MSCIFTRQKHTYKEKGLDADDFFLNFNTFNERNSKEIVIFASQ